MDLGECPNIHDLALRADYELAAKTKDYFYDIDVSISLWYERELYFNHKFINDRGWATSGFYLNSCIFFFFSFSGWKILHFLL